MEKENAKKLYKTMLEDCVEQEHQIESKIRAGVCKMFASMWRVYWECAFEGKNREIHELDERLSPNENAKKLWLTFVHNQKERWTQHSEKLSKFGRKDDSEKEKIKVAQLEKLVKIFEEEME